MLVIKIPMQTPFVPLATSFVEKGAMILGLGEKETFSLTLATEEIFTHLARTAPSNHSIEIRCSSGGYHVKTDFLFSGAELNMRLFNLSASVSLDSEEGLEEMGILIASRFVDRLQLKEGPGPNLCLTLVKEKNYPEIEPRSVLIQAPFEEVGIREAVPEELKLFAMTASGTHPPLQVPRAFRFPGKVVDMVSAGEYHARVAVDHKGGIGGGILWRLSDSKTVECFGPYVFSRDGAEILAEELLGACLSAIAKTQALGLLVRLPTDSLPVSRFEELGSLGFKDGQGLAHSIPTYFRQIHEDPGTISWCHPQSETFLRSEYERMVLPRNIRSTADLGEEKNPFSVLYADFDRPRLMVTLRPVRPGKDLYENLSDHLRLITGESISNVFFEMDLGVAWHAQFTPALLPHGFSPRIVLPYAGEGDVLVFQWEGGK